MVNKIVWAQMGPPFQCGGPQTVTFPICQGAVFALKKIKQGKEFENDERSAILD